MQPGIPGHALLARAWSSTHQSTVKRSSFGCLGTGGVPPVPLESRKEEKQDARKNPEWKKIWVKAECAKAGWTGLGVEEFVSGGRVGL